MATTLHARYVFPIAGDPIADGFVCLEGERILACGAGVPPASEDSRNLGNVAILPGLVNAHAHLDFSGVAAPFGQRGISFVDWLRCVMASRQQPEDRLCKKGAATSTILGLDESLGSGVTAIGDIVQPHEPLVASPVETTAFLELIAPTADRVAAALQLAESYLAAGKNNRRPVNGPDRRYQRPINQPGVNAGPKPPAAERAVNGPEVVGDQNVIQGDMRYGLSPHAPYSVHPDLLTAVVELSREHKIPVAMHLAESPEELELLRHGRGPLREFLGELGAWDASNIALGTRPLVYLRRLASAHRALVVHGNYLDDEEIAFLGANAERMSVVYCPRSHDWFAHRAYPLEKLLAADATVALGTDGRGSSPDLSLMGEMRFATQRHPSVPLAQILRMATFNGARALGREMEQGSLAPGKQANLAVVALPDRLAADPHELLFDPAATVVACYCRGVEAYCSGNAAIS
jgi:aminodeoxyfutalosine deaminase